MPINLEVISLTLDLTGKLLIALTAILVHYRMGEEKKIDRAVIKDIKIEEVLGFFGILFIISGYVIKLNLLL